MIRGSALFKALADKSRLRIVGALRERPLYVELLAERLKLSPSTVSFHLKKLEAAGIIVSGREQYYVEYRLVPGILEQSLRDLILPDLGDEQAQSSREEAYRDKVLSTFFLYGKLKSIPRQRKKRLIVLEHLVESFEIGREYPEKQVNLILADYHEDFCTLRREMVDERLMARASGIYRRLVASAD